MASPSIVGTPTETAISTAGTSHVVNLPSGAAGNLLIAIMDKGSTAATVNALAGWNELLDENSANGLYIAWRLADGTEGATTTFTLSAATRGAWIVYEISGMADPTVQAPQVGTTATGSSTTPNPPSVSVTGGAKDILTIACFGRGGEEADDDTWVTAAPTGFTGLLQKACGVAGTNLGGMIATATLASNTATSDPDTFTCATGAWRAQTIVIHPAPTQTSVARLSLASGTTPTTQTNHTLHVRARVTAGAGTIRMALYEGANNRSGDLESAALTTSLADYVLPISDANAANITDYSDLEIRLWGYAAGGGAIVFEVDQVWLEIPIASAASYTDSATIYLDLQVSGTELAEDVDSATVYLDIQTSDSQVFQGVDSGTISILLTPSAVELREQFDAATVYVDINCNSVDVGQFTDVGIVFLDLDASGADTTQFVDAATVVTTLTPSGTDTFQAVESGSVYLDLQSSGTEFQGREYSDSDSVYLDLTTTSAEVAEAVDAQTVYVLLTPSLVQILESVDAATVYLDLQTSDTQVFAGVDSGTANIIITITSSDVLEAIETATVYLDLQASGNESQSGATNDADTIYLDLRTSDTQIFDAVDADAVYLDLTASGTEVKEGTTTDADTVYLDLQPTQTDAAQMVEAALVALGLSITSSEQAQYVDTASVYLDLEASGTAATEHQDSDMVYLDLSITAVEGFEADDTETVLLVLSPTSVEEFTYGDSALVYLDLQPGTIFIEVTCVLEIIGYTLRWSVSVPSSRWATIAELIGRWTLLQTKRFTWRP